MSLRSGCRIAGLLCLAALAAACTTQPQRAPNDAPASYEQYRTRVQGLQDFSMKGRLAAAARGEGFTAGLMWQQRGLTTTVDLRAALGTASAHIEREAPARPGERDHLRVRTSRGESFVDDEARVALDRRLGFEAPLGSLSYWLRGVSDPARPAIEQLGDDGRPKSFEQDGWRIEIGELGPAVHDRIGALPRRVTITRDDVRLRMIIEEWKVGDAARS